MVLAFRELRKCLCSFWVSCLGCFFFLLRNWAFFGCLVRYLFPVFKISPCMNAIYQTSNKDKLGHKPTGLKIVPATLLRKDSWERKEKFSNHQPQLGPVRGFFVCLVPSNRHISLITTSKTKRYFLLLFFCPMHIFLKFENVLSTSTSLHIWLIGILLSLWVEEKIVKLVFFSHPRCRRWLCTTTNSNTITSTQTALIMTPPVTTPW